MWSSPSDRLVSDVVGGYHFELEVVESAAETLRLGARTDRLDLANDLLLR